MVEPAAPLHALRVADGDVGASARRPLGALLLRDGLISAEQLEEALVEKDQTGARLGEILLSRGWVDPTTLARVLAEQHGLEFVDLNEAKVDRNVAALLPEQYARRYQALPVRFVSSGLVLVAVADPTNVVASDDLRLALGLNVRLAVASAPAIASAIASCYRSEIDIQSYAGAGSADTAESRSRRHFRCWNERAGDRARQQARFPSHRRRRLRPAFRGAGARGRRPSADRRRHAPHDNDPAEPAAGGDEPAQGHG